MKIDRRSFLSFVIGGAAGTALTPLPWKLTDDISIWSQMWPWTPVPERGEVTYVSSACTLCPGGCGINVRLVDQRVVKIEGLEGHPVNDGSLCNLGLSGAQLLYGPRRVKAPMKKTNGRFREISWEQAVAEVAEKLGELRSKGQAHTLACIAGSDRGTVPELLYRLLRVYGSQNLIRMPSIQDSYELTLFLMNGVRATAGFDLHNSDYVLSFGSGLLEGWNSPVNMFKGHSRLLKRGGKLIQFEPRLSNTAAKSEDWIPINPGTEGALALGLAHVIVKESLYNVDFINNYASGFLEWRQLLDSYTPEIVASETGVDALDIKILARNFARARRPLAICGRGQGSTPGSLKEFMAIQALNALVGSIGKEGGFWPVPEPEYIDWPELEMDQTASAGSQQGRIDGAGSKLYPHARFLLNRLPEAFNKSTAYPPVQVLFVSGANPVYSMPDTASVKEIFEKIPMVVSFSSYMDETAEMADLILPNHIYLERYEDVPAAAGYLQPIISLAKPVVEPQFNTMHTGDVVIQLAQALGGTVAAAFPWDSYDTCLEETFGDTWDTLVDQGYWTDADFTPPQWSEAFDTASEKFEFTNKEINAIARYSPVKPEGDEAAFPLVLIPFDSMRLWGGYVASPPFVVKTVEDTILKKNDVLVEINPATAKSLGLKDGSFASLATPKGNARVRVYLFDGIMPGLVALPRGLGHTANDRFLAGRGVNYNTMAGPTEDAASGHDAAWGIRAKLTKA